jgi:GNAT superfamily N-acetyltransferase
MITIREVAVEDAADITVLIHQLGYSISAEQTLHNIHALRESKHHAVFVAVDENVIGWMGVNYNVSMESSPLCEIHGLVVDEQYRNMGIGKLLIEKAKEWCRDKQVDRLRLRCNIKRTEAHIFYINVGFNEIKQQKVYEINI